MREHGTENRLMRDRTGYVSSSNPYVALFYDLLKAGTPAPQDLELLVRANTHHSEQGDPTRFDFTNGHLARYAQDIVSRLEEAKLLDLTYITILMDRQFKADVDAGKSTHDAMKRVVEALLKGKF